MGKMEANLSDCKMVQLFTRQFGIKETEDDYYNQSQLGQTRWATIIQV